VWNVAVYQHLFQALVAPDVKITETACVGAGAPACRFTLSRSGHGQVPERPNTLRHAKGRLFCKAPDHDKRGIMVKF
jgi:hypothetical protein